MQAYIAYGNASLADEIARALDEIGFDCATGSEKDEEQLFQADALVLAVENTEQLARLQAVWQYYLDEIEWKRKESGTIVIVCAEPLKRAYTPFRLKRFPVFTDTRTLTQYLEEQASAPTKPAPTVPQISKPATQITRAAEVTRTVETPQTLDYTPPAVQTPEQPATPTTQLPQLKNRSTACKQDHVFDHTDDEDPKEKYENLKKHPAVVGLSIAVIAICAVVLFFLRCS